jgi:hypothetical protein
MKMLDTVNHTSRIHDVKLWASADQPERDILLVAAEDKLVTVYEIDNDERGSRTIAKFEGHTNRYDTC